MSIKPKQSFYISRNQNQEEDQPASPNAYIFDQKYKTKLQKHKFEHNPKFAYFNTIVKIRNKLSTRQHEVYQMLFDPQSNHEDSKWKNFQIINKNKLNMTNLGWRTKQLIGNEQAQQMHNNTPSTYRNSVKQISFQSSSRHTRKQSEIYYDRKPRLDDILAEYRRMSRRQKKQKQKSANLQRTNNNKVTQQFMMFNRTGRLLPRQFSQGQKQKRAFSNV